MDLDKIKNIIREFAKQRDWDKFHTPKNLSMALSVEASELVEIFQWLSQEESKNIDSNEIQNVKDEVADILIYVIRIADKLNIDLEKAVLEKIDKNNEKYPIDLSKGNAVKYNKR